MGTPERCEKKKKRSRKTKNDDETAVALKKGSWTLEEDEKLMSCIQKFGQGSWRSLALKAGLKRCGKSCRLRWNNYLRPDIKKGTFSLEEERTIIQLHALLGNRWSAIAQHLPKRTDSKIKNHWNSHIKKRLAKMGIDPMTHKPKDHTHLNGSNLSHMTQWESARLEAEARLVQQPKNYPYQQPHLIATPSTRDPHKRSNTAQPYLQYQLSSKNLINEFQAPNSACDILKDVPLIIPTTSIMSSFNQGLNTKPYEKIETLMEPFEEFVDTHDANYITGNPLIKPQGFMEECADLPISGDENRGVIIDRWGCLSNNSVNSWPPCYS